MVVHAPTRTLEQRLDALARGNSIRLARAALKRRLHTDRYLNLLLIAIETRDAGRDLVATAPAGYLDTMKVQDLLTSAQGIGDVKASKILTKAMVSPAKTVGGVSPRQRAALIDAVERLAAYRVEVDAPKVAA